MRPAIGDRHGHPVVFDRVTFDDLRSAPLDVGAKAVLARWRHAIVDVPVDDPGVLADVDTPEDYEAFLRERRPLSAARPGRQVRGEQVDARSGRQGDHARMRDAPLGGDRVVPLAYRVGGADHRDAVVAADLARDHRGRREDRASRLAERLEQG